MVFLPYPLVSHLSEWFCYLLNNFSSNGREIYRVPNDYYTLLLLTVKATFCIGRTTSERAHFLHSLFKTALAIFKPQRYKLQQFQTF